MTTSITPLLLESIEVGLLKDACNHMIEFYDQDLKRHQTYSETKNSEETKAVIQLHIENDVNLVGYYQRLKEKLENNATTTTTDSIIPS